MWNYLFVINWKVHSKYSPLKSERRSLHSKHSSSSSVVVFRLRLQKTSSRRLQDVLIKTNIFALVIRFQDVFKTSSRCLAKTSSRRFKDVFNTSSRHLQDILASLRRLQNVFMTSAKASLRYLQGVLQRCLQDVLKTYYQVKLFA